VNRDVLITDAAESDLPSIGLLISELFEAMDTPPVNEPEQAVENCLALIRDPSHHVLVARSGASVVGLINFTIRRTLSHARPSGLIDELIVLKKHQGRGIGKRLISAAERKCRDLGCEELEVSTEKSNSAAREFYGKCGFDEDSVLLEMSLDK